MKQAAVGPTRMTRTELSRFRLTPIRQLASLLWPRRFITLDKLNRLPGFISCLRLAEGRLVAPDKLSLHTWTLEQIGFDNPVDYLEFGVSKGNTFRLWLQHNRHPASRFFGFDTFEGLPNAWTGTRFAAGAFSTGGKLPDIIDSRATFIKGLFQNTVPGFMAEFHRNNRPLVIHHDADLYSSTAFCLAVTNGLLRPDDLVILDDFANLLHVHRAWTDYCDAFGRQFHLLTGTPHLTTVTYQLTR